MEPPTVEHKPMSKIVIHQIERFEMDEFLRFAIIPNKQRIAWADGIFIDFAFFNGSNDKIIEESLDGTMHVGSLDFCEGPFKKILKHPDGNMEMGVLNQSENRDVKAMVKFLKDDGWLKKS